MNLSGKSRGSPTARHKSSTRSGKRWETERSTSCLWTSERDLGTPFHPGQNSMQSGRNPNHVLTLWGGVNSSPRLRLGVQPLQDPFKDPLNETPNTSPEKAPLGVCPTKGGNRVETAILLVYQELNWDTGPERCICGETLENLRIAFSYLRQTIFPVSSSPHLRKPPVHLDPKNRVYITSAKWAAGTPVLPWHVPNPKSLKCHSGSKSRFFSR